MVSARVGTYRRKSGPWMLLGCVKILTIALGLVGIRGCAALMHYRSPRLHHKSNSLAWGLIDLRIISSIYYRFRQEAIVASDRLLGFHLNP